uniref:Putative methyltransferase n=1 Tax=viral metagenome TaxID=1070528 RepID=A0A6M3JQE2_9ZZZZ
MGYLAKDQTIMDPFGGIGGGGIMAASMGLKWIGVELEEKFVDLAKQNFTLHSHAWDVMGYPQPTIIQGDSRRLSSVLQGADLIATSPPFVDCLTSKDEKFNSLARPGRTDQNSDYGQSPGQIGNMKSGSIDAVITSPPFSEFGCQPMGKCPSRPVRSKRKAMGIDDKTEYGWTKGQIGNLRAGDVEALIEADLICTSPPFEGNPQAYEKLDGKNLAVRKNPRHPGEKLYFTEYIQPNSPGQLGQTSGESYWQAVADVYRECFKILKPQGIIIIVVKSYIKAGRRVPLPMQMLKLLIHLGFVPLERIKAMLVEETVTQGLFGDIVKKKERKSFFRRLAEKRGSPEINFEEVLVCKKT